MIQETIKKEFLGIYMIWLRDARRYYRDKPRIIGSFAQPVLFLLVLGTGLASSFAFFGGGDAYLNFMFPGVLGMTILFTSFFDAMSIVWDREFGFLKEVLISPISRTSIVIGKILGGSKVPSCRVPLFFFFCRCLPILLL